MAKARKNCSLLNSDIEEYCALTYFSRKDILRLYDHFAKIHASTNSEEVLLEARISADEFFERVQELKHCPFQERLKFVFSSARDGKFSFDDFVDLASAFSSKVPAEVRATFAFRIYDFDNDGLITESDVTCLINNLTGFNDPLNSISLPSYEREAIIEYILEEASLKSRAITEDDFHRIINKLPDFATSFKIPL